MLIKYILTLIESAKKEKKEALALSSETLDYDAVITLRRHGYVVSKYLLEDPFDYNKYEWVVEWTL